jgi:TusA-related sulfurtransferase
MATRSKHVVKENPDYMVDVQGAIAPFSLLKVSLVFQKMKTSEVVEVLGCDAEMQQDLLRLLPDASCEVVCTVGIDPGVKITRVRFRKQTGQQGQG